MTPTAAITTTNSTDNEKLLQKKGKKNVIDLQLKWKKLQKKNKTAWTSLRSQIIAAATLSVCFLYFYDLFAVVVVVVEKVLNRKQEKEIEKLPTYLSVHTLTHWKIIKGSQ